MSQLQRQSIQLSLRNRYEDDQHHTLHTTVCRVWTAIKSFIVSTQKNWELDNYFELTSNLLNRYFTRCHIFSTKLKRSDKHYNNKTMINIKPTCTSITTKHLEISMLVPWQLSYLYSLNSTWPKWHTSFTYCYWIICKQYIVSFILSMYVCLVNTWQVQLLAMKLYSDNK